MSLAADAADALEREVTKLEAQVVRLQALARAPDQEVEITIVEDAGGGVEMERTIAAVTLRSDRTIHQIDIKIENPKRISKIRLAMVAVGRGAIDG